MTADEILGIAPRHPYLAEAAAGRRGVTVVIPTHTRAGGPHIPSIELCLRSLGPAAATSGLPVAVLVADNGLSTDAGGRLVRELRGLGIEHEVIDTARRGNAAFARNAALTRLAALPGSSPLRNRYLLFLDDDNALAPGALDCLVTALEDRPRAVGVCPRISTVADLAHWVPAPGGSEPRRLRGALRDGRYDLLSVTSHGSLVTGRVVGLLVRQQPLLAWLHDGGRLFFEGTPYGSSEDMLAMASLGRLGELWRVPAAEVADLARRTPGDTRRQQMAWGYDHAWLARTLAGAGLLDPGVHALWWHEETGWTQRTVEAPGTYRYVVHPPELQMAAGLLGALTRGPVAREMLGDRAGAVEAGRRCLERALSCWVEAWPHAHAVPRPDLPRRATRGWDTLRDGLDSLLGHVAGNLIGSLENGLDGDGLPRYCVYGARQPAWALL